MKLYYAPGACSLSPHIIAREAGLPIELSKVSFDGTKRTTEQGEDFFVVNPRGGYVPVLRLDDDDILIEGPAILQYLADQALEKRLMPKHGDREYYRALSWITFISTELHKGFSPLFNPHLPEEQRASVVDRIKVRYAYVEKALAQRHYVLGDTFCTADAYLYTILRWSPRAGIALTEYPNLAAFMKRMENRTAVQTALKEEELEPVA